MFLIKSEDLYVLLLSPTQNNNVQIIKIAHVNLTFTINSKIHYSTMSHRYYRHSNIQ